MNHHLASGLPLLHLSSNGKTAASKPADLGSIPGGCATLGWVRTLHGRRHKTPYWISPVGGFAVSGLLSCSRRRGKPTDMRFDPRIHTRQCHDLRHNTMYKKNLHRNRC